MEKKREIKFVCYAVRWFDRINGNTYHSVRVERVKDGLKRDMYRNVSH